MGEAGRAIVVGAGIGGLAATIALAHRGWQVEVLEQAGRVGEAGSALTLWPNGLRVLDELGVGERVRARGAVETEGGMRNPAGAWLAKTDTAEITRRYGQLVAVHRADLFEVLRSAVPEEALRLGSTVTGIAHDGAEVKVTHSGGVSSADLVVGADGLRSVVRESLCPNVVPRYVGYTAWRMITAPLPDVHGGGETFGRGRRCGIVPLPDGRVYTYFTANVPAGQRSPDGELTELHRHFDTWHDPIPTLLGAVDPDAVLRHDIYDLPPLRTFAGNRIALLGDAAHAMTPNLGQGANQALEDALTLAILLDRNPIEQALTTYDQLRLPHTQALVRRSRNIGTVLQWESPLANLLRDTAIRLTPPTAAIRALAPALTWQPPH